MERRALEKTCKYSKCQRKHTYALDSISNEKTKEKTKNIMKQKKSKARLNLSDFSLRKKPSWWF